MADSVLVIGSGDDAVDFSSGEAGMETLRRSCEWLWPSQQPIGGRPAHSSTGIGMDKITLGGLIFPAQVGAADAVERLRALANLRQPQPMADGEGRAYGSWVIRSIEEEQKGWYPGGTPRKITWSLELEAYTEREASA